MPITAERNHCCFLKLNKAPLEGEPSMKLCCSHFYFKYLLEFVPKVDLVYFVYMGIKKTKEPTSKTTFFGHMTYNALNSPKI